MEAGGDHGSVVTGSFASVVLTTRAAQVLWRHGWPVDAAAGARCSRPVSMPFSSRLPSGRRRAGAAGQGRGSLSGGTTDRAAPRGRRATAPAPGRGPATALRRPITEYSEGMNESSSSRSIGRMAVAALVLLIAVYVLLKIVLAIALAIALPVAVIFAVVAIIWAWRVLF
jgi:hypothetical protein